jgi:release factor glutamine methyltransferase
VASRDPLTRAAAVQWARQSVDRLDARLLLEFCAACDANSLITDPDVTLTPDQWQAYQVLVSRRAAGEPLAYLVGEAGFYGHRLYVDPAVLIPRPETEDLVDWALEVLKDCTAPMIVDLGTGSGAIALALAHARPDARVWGVDISRPALGVAETNRQRLALQNIEWQWASWLTGWQKPSAFDLIISNPPYIPANDPHLKGDGVCFEPVLALTDGADGLDAYRSLAGESLPYLKPGGWLLVEHGHDQSETVAGFWRDAGLVEVSGRKDLSGNPRMTGGRRPERDHP